MELSAPRRATGGARDGERSCGDDAETENEDDAAFHCPLLSLGGSSVRPLQAQGGGKAPTIGHR